MKSEVRLYLGLITLYLYLEGCTSLKEKRRILHAITDRVRSRCSVSVAEVGFQNKHQRSVVAAACVGSDKGFVERVLQDVRTIAESRDGAVLSDWQIEWR